jgi:ATP-binding cassette subfamily C (CFTR/MRP) protein 1
MTFQRSEESAKGDKDQVEVANAVNLQPLNLQLDTGDEYTNFRHKWWQLW